jgi:hypothetical protein
VLIVVAQLGHVLDSLRVLSYEGTLAESLVVLHQVEFGAELIDIGHQTISWDASERILEHSIELVARNILSVSGIAGCGLLLAMLGPI